MSGAAMVGPVRCATDLRRETLLARRAGGEDITGIDYVEVSADQREIFVRFLGAAPPPPGLVGSPDQVRVVGGRRVPVRVTEVSTTVVDGVTVLVVAVDQPGDFSDYVLELPSLPQLDEAYRRCAFNFKAACPTRFDCQPPARPEPPRPAGIDVDYMAKDYASFRQALVDLIPRLAPQWTERLAADFGMTMLELLAYAGDQLSYYQDAVANEAFLETARQRVSVRRHARLVDYHMHEGASARALVHFRMAEGKSLEVSADDEPFELLSRIAEPIGAAPPGTTIGAEHRERAVALAAVVFRTFGPGHLDWRLNEVRFHTWGNAACGLPRAATAADLAGDLRPVLDSGDLLLIEEVKDPRTGDPTLADPSHRQVVRLTAVEMVRDELLGQDVTRVRWRQDDAVTFPVCIAGTSRTGTTIQDVSVARGNLLLADHGLAVAESGLSADPIATGNRAARFTLERGPLSYRPRTPGADQPAAALLRTEPEGAAPQVTRLRVSGTLPDDDWQPVATLIGSDRFDHHFAVETDNAGKALIRFGDDVFGSAAPRSAIFDVEYRVGIGPEGNVGADAIRHVVGGSPALQHVIDGEPADAIVAIRNPLPAWGGVAPESVARVKRVAPAAFRARQHRAVTEADYAEMAERHPLVRKAVARFRWTGSWHTVFIAIDPRGRLGLDDEDAETVRAHTRPFAQAGYDLRIIAPTYVPLRVGLEVCVERDHFRADVEQAVRAALSTGEQPDGRRGFFHPDRFTFGTPLYLSAVYAAVAEVEGVDAVVAVRFARLHDDENTDLGTFTQDNLEAGEIGIGPLEILRVDDDPDFPEHGILDLIMQGGK
jgi:hypothetical protein